MYVLGALAAYWLLIRLGRRYAPEIEQVDLSRLYVICYISGYFGARLLSIIVEEPEVHGVWDTVLALARFGPMTFYGGAIGCFCGGVLYVWRRRLPLPTLIDLGIPPGLLALAIGRVGCFLNGDDYGKAAPTGGSLSSGEHGAPWWAVTFPNLQDGIARYPVQLMEAGAVAIVVGVLCWNFGRIRAGLRRGAVGYLGIIAYANLRFLLEFLRDDFRGFAFGTWLSTSQFISIVVLAICGLILPFWVRRPTAAPTT